MSARWRTGDTHGLEDLRAKKWAAAHAANKVDQLTLLVESKAPRPMELLLLPIKSMFTKHPERNYICVRHWWIENGGIEAHMTDEAYYNILRRAVAIHHDNDRNVVVGIRRERQPHLHCKHCRKDPGPKKGPFYDYAD